MTKEFDETKRLVRDLFRVRIDRPSHIRLGYSPGNALPARLTLTLQDRPEIERALLDRERGAILEVDLDWNAVIDLYEQIEKFSQKSDLSLQKPNKGPA